MGGAFSLQRGGARRENVISGLVFLGRAASLVQGCTLYRVVGRRPRTGYILWTLEVFGVGWWDGSRAGKLTSFRKKLGKKPAGSISVLVVVLPPLFLPTLPFAHKKARLHLPVQDRQSPCERSMTSDSHTRLAGVALPCLRAKINIVYGLRD